MTLASQKIATPAYLNDMGVKPHLKGLGLRFRVFYECGYADGNQSIDENHHPGGQEDAILAAKHCNNVARPHDGAQPTEKDTRCRKHIRADTQSKVSTVHAWSSFSNLHNKWTKQQDSSLVLWV